MDSDTVSQKHLIKPVNVIRPDIYLSIVSFRIKGLEREKVDLYAVLFNH